MLKVLLASHGTLAKAMKETAAFLLGENENVHTLCAYVDEDSMNLSSLVDAWSESRKENETWVVMTDLFGGSVNNEFMNRLPGDDYFLIAGMNLPLVISVLSEEETTDCEKFRQMAEDAREMMVYCNDMLTESTDDEDF